MKIRFARLLIALITSVSVCPVRAAVDLSPQEKFAHVVELLNAHKSAEALVILEDLSKTYPTPAVYWNLGLSAAEVGDNHKALQAWLSYREVHPNNWQVRAKLVQTYQALGDLAARDQARADLFALWQAGTDKQLNSEPIFCREQFKQDGRKVMVLEYFNPSGPRQVVYSFVVLQESGQQDFKISLGSYDRTNQIALELGQRPSDKRIYHLDLYRANLHETHGMYLGQPSYDETRLAVVNVLSRKIPAIAGASAAAPASQ